MTKGQWKCILEELKTFRSTNKFQSKLWYKARQIDEQIEKIDTNFGVMILSGRIIFGHQDVINVSPSDFKQRFYFKQNPFAINTIQFN